MMNGQVSFVEKVVLELVSLDHIEGKPFDDGLPTLIQTSNWRSVP